MDCIPRVWTYEQYSLCHCSQCNHLPVHMANVKAALDLVGPTVPKAVVLLADVLPSFLFKAVAPYFFHVVPYKFVPSFRCLT
jgi:hypothetical protein